MKRLLILFALLAVALTVNAQTPLSNITNIRISITLTNGTTANINWTPNQRVIEGFALDYLKQVMVAEQQTNTPPTIQQAVEITGREALKPLAKQAEAHERKQAKVEAFVPTIPEIWDLLTSQERNQLTAMATKYMTNSP